MSIHFYRDNNGSVGQREDPRDDALNQIDDAADLLAELRDMIADLRGDFQSAHDSVREAGSVCDATARQWSHRCDMVRAMRDNARVAIVALGLGR